jgi:hypothetical protein
MEYKERDPERLIESKMRHGSPTRTVEGHHQRPRSFVKRGAVTQRRSGSRKQRIDQLRSEERSFFEDSAYLMEGT